MENCCGSLSRVSHKRNVKDRNQWQRIVLGYEKANVLRLEFFNFSETFSRARVSLEKNRAEELLGKVSKVKHWNR